MARIKLSKLRFKPLIDSIYENFNLTSQQAHVYGYFWNHCMNLNDDGWCGYSDERIAKDLRLGVKTFKRELTVLKNKNLIFIKNPGKRTKRTGESRMIYLNTEYFIDDMVDEKDLEKIELRKENAHLRAEVERVSAIVQQLQKDLDARPRLYPNIFLQQIIDSGYISDADVPRACVVLNPGYELLAKCFHEEVQKHVTYMIRCLDNAEIKPSDTISYLSKALVYRFQYLHAKRYKEPYNGQIIG